MTYALPSDACDVESMVYAKVVMQDLAVIFNSFNSLSYLPILLQNCASPFRISDRKFWRSLNGTRLPRVTLINDKIDAAFGFV